MPKALPSVLAMPAPGTPPGMGPRVAPDACIKPRIKAYLEKSSGRIEEALGEVPFLVMKSNGGVSSAREVAKKPIATVLSGPAGGVIAQRTFRIDHSRR